ncbi:hypothetical protein HA466_0313500 [Hirschfeldia incana]|nr:hypothetical protein HA466_0313500 [Hirschfeldia incana]
MASGFDSNIDFFIPCCVPILDSSSIKWVQPNTLVRFRGMIQDMLRNEFYAGAYKDDSTWRTNKYSDVSQFPDASTSDMQVWERRLLYCVPCRFQDKTNGPNVLLWSSRTVFWISLAKNRKKRAGWMKK